MEVSDVEVEPAASGRIDHCRVGRARARARRDQPRELPRVV